jgi:putative membrane protein
VARGRFAHHLVNVLRARNGRGEVRAVQPNVTSRAGAQAPEQAPGRTAGSEPDYRFTLANERTFLAWFRTALALIAGGVAVVQLVPALAFPGARQVLGILLTVAGGGLSLAAALRWRRVQAAMRREEDLPPTPIPVILGLGLAVLTAIVVVLLLSGRSA